MVDGVDVAIDGTPKEKVVEGEESTSRVSTFLDGVESGDKEASSLVLHVEDKGLSLIMLYGSLEYSTAELEDSLDIFIGMLFSADSFSSVSNFDFNTDNSLWLGAGAGVDAEDVGVFGEPVFFVAEVVAI